MKKLIALALSLALLLGCVSALAETEQKTLQATIDMNGVFALKCYLPEGYVVQNAGMTGGTYVASISHATDSSKPAMMLSIAFDELLADIDRLNDLDDEALAKIAATFAEEDDIEVTYSETHLGTKMMVVKDMTDTTDYVDFFTIYKGYEMEFVLVKDLTGESGSSLTDEEIEMAVQFLSDLEFDEVK